ncbi:unnamed protein product [Ectocarpus sp. 12 AP-2014]
MTSGLGVTVLEVFVGDPRSSEFVDHARYGQELKLDPFQVHEFTDEDDAAAAEWQQVAGRKLTKMCRAGIPEYFRGGVWNKVMSPTMEEAGTPSHKLQQERIWTRVLERVFEGDGMSEEVPGYGGELRLEDHCMSAEGRAAVRRLLVTIKHMLAVEWSPSLLDVVPVLLTYMPESCVYGVVEELWGMRPLFFPHTEEEFEAWAATFKNMVKDFFPETSKEMSKCGADEPEHLRQVLLRMFVPILPLKYLVVVWDAWFCEGSKVIFRYGLALLKMYKKRLKALKLKQGQGAQWWSKLRDWVHEPSFSFDDLANKAFSLRTKSGLRPISWAMLENYHDKNEAEVKSRMDKVAGSRLDHKGVAADRADEAQPFFWPPFQLTATFPPPVLLADVPARAKLVKWVPEILRHKRLRVVFTTEIHGYNLDLLYSHCRTVSPSLLVVEAANGVILGGFCSDSWQYPHAKQSQGGMYGSGQCFLFRLHPQPTTCRWQGGADAADIIKQRAQKQTGTGFHLPHASRHRSSGTGLAALSAHSSSHALSSWSKGESKHGGNGESLGSSKHGGRLGQSSRHAEAKSSGSAASKREVRSASSHKQRGSMLRSESFGLGSVHKKQPPSVATESFMMTTKDFLAMGSSPVTSNCGLKLYNDLTRGSSDACETYGNERLVDPTTADFAVTCVEVYAFE